MFSVLNKQYFLYKKVHKVKKRHHLNKKESRHSFEKSNGKSHREPF